jgi:hypothetical protein
MRMARWVSTLGATAGLALALAAGQGLGEAADADAAPACDPSKWRLPEDGRYDTAGRIADDKLNVHLIPHSHDDPCVLCRFQWLWWWGGGVSGERL